jgi:hypothetical protein
MIPALLALMALFVRFPLVHAGTPFYNSDTAILDLMARHMMKGEFSVYYWGQSYYGTLDSALLAVLFKMFGYGPLVSLLLPYFFTGTFILLYYRYLAESLDPRTALASTLILAVGSPYFLQTTFNSYCYIVVLNFGMAFLLMARRMQERGLSRGARFFFGTLMGFSWYYLHLVLVFWAAAFLSLVLPILPLSQLRDLRFWISALSVRRIWNEWIFLRRVELAIWAKRLLVLVNLANAVNFAIAVVLWFHGDWIGNIHGHVVKLFFEPIFASSLEMTGLILAVVFRREILAFIRRLNQSGALTEVALGFLVGYAPALWGSLSGHKPARGAIYPTLSELMRNFRVAFKEIPPFMFRSGPAIYVRWFVFLLSWGGVGMLLYEACAACRSRWRGETINPPHPFVSLAAVTLLAGLFTGKLVDVTTARYFLPLYIAMPVGIFWLLGKTVRQPFAVWVLLGAFLVCNLAANRRLFSDVPRPAPYADVAHTLEDRGYLGGYADYWMAYAITALSGEHVVLVPTGDNDRYKPYLDYVRSLERVVLLGDSPGPVGSLVTIKGVPYRLVALDQVSGIPLAILRKMT